MTAGIGFAFGVGAGGAGDSQGSRTLGKHLPPGGGSPARGRSPGERKRLRWSCGLRLCWGGSGHVFLARPRNKFLFQTVISLSLPSRVAEFEANNQSYFPVVVPPLSLPCWHCTVAAAGGDYGCAGWEQPRLCLPPTLQPGVPSLGRPSGVGMASGIWHQELELSSFAIRGIGKKPQILEWFEKEAWFGAKHPRRSMQTPPSLQPCPVAVPTSPCPLS